MGLDVHKHLGNGLVLCQFSLCQVVYDLVWGEGRVTSLTPHDEDDSYPVEVEFVDGNETVFKAYYTNEGVDLNTDARTLFSSRTSAADFVLKRKKETVKNYSIIIGLWSDGHVTEHTDHTSLNAAQLQYHPSRKLVTCEVLTWVGKV